MYLLHTTIITKTMPKARGKIIRAGEAARARYQQRVRARDQQRVHTNASQERERQTERARVLECLELRYSFDGVMPLKDAETSSPNVSMNQSTCS